ncbi:MAG: tRNA (adenosine(37)-N6)-threonylcarbamoyltransferase complex transferase subunit TsaD [Clostridiales bacterium]|nr:tRNA (adenosine(37)-N6)-threonylcarbamoyltransferase complex transferase subunit TsaD [Clostridiales bacterium]MCF8022077.1 tRNA (adenosine(37)-N6)-threonylcarbamoyltransferase complex transferase subunit TsaD [Clostridiales bacterium]
MTITILGIETSCDETAASVVVDGREISSNVISSQIDIHSKFGGVVPEEASRKHLETINAVIQEALDEAGITFKDLDAVAVTYGPGLVGALLVGVSAAKSLACALDVPLLAVNHLEGHVSANFLSFEHIEFPVLCLVVSGGHTDLVIIKKHGVYEAVGSTRDDAAGEAFDKVARVLELGYPGGPVIEKAARCGNSDTVHLPRAYLEEGSLDFSFSGVKTAVINYTHKLFQNGEALSKENLAASFQKAVIDVLVDKTMDAAVKYSIHTLMLAGGVAANTELRRSLSTKAVEEGLKLFYPPPVMCTDNAAMIACAGYYKFLKKDYAPLTLNAVPGLELGNEKY